MVKENKFTQVEIFTMVLEELGFSNIYGTPVTGDLSKTYEYDLSDERKYWIKIISEDNKTIWGYAYLDGLLSLHHISETRRLDVYLYEPNSIDRIKEFLRPT